MGFLKAIFGKGSGKKAAAGVENDGVRFFHHNPPRGNIGDFLCSPRHYFALEPAIPGLNIIGGGVYVDMGVKFIQKHGIDPQKTVLWGVGESLRDVADPEPINHLPFLEWSCRDRNRVVDDTHFVPCCSCLHRMLDSPVTSQNTLLFLNADPKVSGEGELAELATVARHRGWELLYNNCAEQAFSEALARSKSIVTNSYHGAYWGLLSGRTVALIGYSSKFHSLFSGLGLPPEKVVQYDRGDERALVTTLRGLELEASGACLPDPEAVRRAFRARNKAFADRLVARKILAGYRFSARVPQPE